MTPRIAAALLSLLVLSACSTGGGGTGERQSLLRSIGLRQPAPDEFLIVERRPLEMPGSYSELPAPAPGGSNRVDPQPRADVAALLSRNAEPRNDAAGLSPGEAALIGRSGAEATDPAIRETVNAEDAVRASGPGLYGLRTLFGRKTNDPYRADALDADAETTRLRESGVQVPAAPPPPPPDDPSVFTLF